MRFILAFIIVSVILSCSKEKKILVESELPEFTSLRFIDRFDILLVQDTFNYVEMSGHPKLLEGVHWELIGDELVFSSKGGSAWLRPKNNRIILTIHVKSLCKIYLDETCFLKTTNTWQGDELGLIMAGKVNEADIDVNCNTFYTWNNFPCGGKITLSGSATVFKCWTYALLQIDATSLQQETAIVESNTKGDVILDICNNLQYKISNSGNIRVKGVPGNITNLGNEGKGELIFY
ncbi:MAG: hypothetical protein EP305_01970 [Bacteroidetes bacterium]|nr:MAG: hypothetical protein EP305_01970 [Bacteroidota bacterium]